MTFTLCALAPATAPIAAREGEPPPRIHWLPWSDETFARAAAEGRPILLNVRAPWSRSSQYMDDAIYTDPDVVKLVTERWLPVSVDRDRRPDIDIRYQLAVFVVARGEAGWPLTLFLQPDGQALFGGTFIPLDDRMKKAGMKTLLEKISDLYGRHPEAAAGTLEVVKKGFERTDAPHRPPEINVSMIEEVGRNLISSVDHEYGGFGGTPRLPKPFALELAATLYHRTKDKALLDAMVRTLDGMERGTIYDRVGGGFHRMTGDPAWRYPEFEKLATYNANLLRSYLLGVEATGSVTYRNTASRTLDYMLSTLADPGGGFRVGQSSGNGGTEPAGLAYSWTQEEFEKAIPQGREKIAGMLFNVTKEGELVLGDPPRNLMYLAMGRDEAARRLGISVDALREGEQAILDRLAAARAGRRMPPVIDEVYVDSSALAAVAMLDAWRVLGREDARRTGLATVDRLLAAVPAGGVLRHRLVPPPDPATDPALALDHVMLATAALAAYEETHDAKYLAAARDLSDRIMSLFWDVKEGGVFDVVEDPNAHGYLSIRRRLSKDIAYPALNAQTARVFDRLALHTGDTSYRDRAEKCLKKLVSIMKELDFQDSGLALAVESHLRPPTRYVVVGKATDPRTDELYEAARHVFNPGSLVVRLEPGRDDEELDRLGLGKAKGAFVAECLADKCSAPMRDGGELNGEPASR